MRLDDLEDETGGCRRIECIPAADASQCVDATMPKVPRSSGLVVNTGAL
jgi:hypothetical protein